MNTEAKITTNMERLKKNLKAGSLASQLVAAYENAKPDERPHAIQAILQTRLDHLRTTLETPKHLMKEYLGRV
jgi:hypothetical protein